MTTCLVLPWYFLVLRSFSRPYRASTRLALPEVYARSSTMTQSTPSAINVTDLDESVTWPMAATRAHPTCDTRKLEVSRLLTIEQGIVGIVGISYSWYNQQAIVGIVGINY